MKKNRIRLTESQLQKVITESVNSVLKGRKLDDSINLGNEAISVLRRFLQSKFPNMSSKQIDLKFVFLVNDLAQRTRRTEIKKEPDWGY